MFIWFEVPWTFVGSNPTTSAIFINLMVFIMSDYILIILMFLAAFAGVCGSGDDYDPDAMP